MIMDKPRHIIHQQRIEVGMPAGKSPFALQERIRNIYYDKIIPGLDSVFSGIAGEDTIIRIDRLHLDVGAVNMDKLEDELTELVIRAVQKSLADKLRFDAADSGHTEVITVKRSAAETLLYFLEYGRLPWWSVVDQLAGLEELVLQQWEVPVISRQKESLPSEPQRGAMQGGRWTDDLPARLRRLVEEEEYALDRLIFQFSDVFLRKILSVCYPDVMHVDLDPGYVGSMRARKWRAVFRSATRTGRSGASAMSAGSPNAAAASPTTTEDGESSTTSSAFTAPAIDDPSSGERASLREESAGTSAGSPGQSADDNPSPDGDRPIDPAIEGAYGEMRGQPGMTQAPADPKRKQYKKPPAQHNKIRTLDDPDALYLGSAGLVLLHPFLTPFFEGLQLLEEKTFRDEEARQKGVHLLGYLSTGEVDLEEPLLLFPKVLCGMELTQPVQRNEVLTPEERSEADHLLDVVIGYWKALKNTSKAGLQTSFLQRQGKLSRKEDGWQLDVEKKTWDILLGSLPWGYSIVRLPWMKEMVFVNWS